MQFAIDALTLEFTAITGTPCEVIISSSGKLTAQIMQGAPYDIFLSADMKYPKQLIEAQKALDPVKVYAKGSLILWTLRPDLLLDSSQNAVDLLSAPEVNHIALANPKTAPYGRAALEVLNHYELLDILEEKLVYGESIAQTNQFVTTQAAELGFTTKSVVFAPHLKDSGRWIELSDSIYQSIQQGAVLLQNDAMHPKAQEFMKFLQSAAAKKILNNFGYITK
jgi:molybdate transport system substrate-binding protein